MFLWITIIISVLFACWGYRKGFFVMAATLFNLMVAIFIGVLSTPKLLSLSEGFENSGYYAAANVFFLCILIFGVLQFFAYFYFLRDSEVFFPKLFDKVGALVFGFLFGYLICCILIFSFCIMPCSTKVGANYFCSRNQLENLSVPCVRKVCNFTGWYSLHCFDRNSERQIHHLLSLAHTPEEIEEEGRPSFENIEDIIDDSKEGETLKDYAPGG